MINFTKQKSLQSIQQSFANMSRIYLKSQTKQKHRDVQISSISSAFYGYFPLLALKQRKAVA